MPEIYVEDIENLYKTLFYGQQIKAVITIYSSSAEIKKEVIATIKEIFPYHVLCECEDKIYSVQMVDIALKNRGLL